MTTGMNQPDLFPRSKLPENLLDYLRGRLPQGDMLSVSDMANALKVSTGTVRSWIKTLRLQAINMGSEEKPCWRIYRRSALDLLEEMTRQKELTNERTKRT